MTLYQDLIDASLRTTRPLDQRKEQGEYFDAMGAVLQQPPKDNAVVAILEADTGVGKAIGYLAVLALDAANNGRQSVVSTFTRQLRDQIIEEEAQAVIDTVYEMTGKRVTIKPWLAMNSFVSVTRAQKKLEEMIANGETKADIDLLQEWIDYASNSSRLFEDAMSEDGNLVLPSTVLPSEIWLTKSCPKSERAEYEDLRDEHAGGPDSDGADILVVTHALTCLDALLGGSIISKRRKGCTLVLDEAHKLPDAADTILVYNRKFKETSGMAGQIRQEAELVLRGLGKEHEIIDARNKVFANLIKLCQQAYATKSDEWEGMERFLYSVRRYADEKNADPDALPLMKPIISSAQRPDLPALIATSISPVRVIRRLFKHRIDDKGQKVRFYDHVVFTGATLEPALIHEMDLTNIAEPHLSKYGSGAITPQTFGEQEYIFAIKTGVPNPMIIDQAQAAQGYEVRVVNPAYVSHVTNMIIKAKDIALEMKDSAGSFRTMVLVPSFEDVKKIADELQKTGRLGNHFLLHKSGTSLKTLLEQYAEDPQAVLISPSIWEGINLPGMIQSLVIARIPFEPPSAVKSIFLKHLSFVHSRHRATAKFRQGIGRTLRRMSDFANVAIADPRFPLHLDNLSASQKLRYHESSRTSKLKVFSLLPPRFKDNIKRARVVGKDGV